MACVTHGRIHHTTTTLPLTYQPQELFSTTVNVQDRYKLVFLRSGNGLLRLNDQQHPIIAPTVCCFTETDAVEFCAGTDIAAESIYFHPTVINESLTFERLHAVAGGRPGNERKLSAGSLDYDSLIPFHRKPHDGVYAVGPVTELRLYTLMQTLRQQLEEQPDRYWPCRSRSYLQEILFLVLHISVTQTNSDSERALPPMSAHMDSLILYLVNHYHRKITLNDIAKTCGTNRNTLNQQCKQATGVTVMEYVIRLRVRLACRLLQDTTLPIAEIAERVGYADVTHFGRMFRKHVRLTPSDYRARHQEP